MVGSNVPELAQYGEVNTHDVSLSMHSLESTWWGRINGVSLQYAHPRF